jgi:hypothetical protein
VSGPVGPSNDKLLELTFIGERAAFTVASAWADSYLMGKEQQEKIVSEIPSFLEKHGVKTDADTLSKLWESKDRAMAHDGRALKDWAYQPSWRPGTAEKLTHAEALSRLVTRVKLSTKFRRSSLPLGSMQRLTL